VSSVVKKALTTITEPHLLKQKRSMSLRATLGELLNRDHRVGDPEVRPSAGFW
jgi:hypothetical protein